MIKFFILTAVLLMGTRWLKKRHQRNFQHENEARARLGLPPLTAAQYQLTPVEKSADYRHNINQHM